METVSLIKELREQGVRVKLIDNQLEIAMLTKEIDPTLLQKLKNQKQDIINYLSSISTKNVYQEIPKVEISDSYVVSNAQLRLWLESQSEKASVAYHMPFEMYLEGYDIIILEKAIQYVIKRHEILRTVFRLDADKELKQYVLPQENVCFDIDYKDFTGGPDGETKAQKYIKTLVDIPFKLDKGPLIRTSVIQYKTNSFIFFCNLHHIICDAWSIPILKQEILMVYESLCAKETPNLSELRIQYKDYAFWYVNGLQNRLWDRQKKYWLSQFKDEIPVLEFPSKNTRPPVKTYNGQTLRTYFGREESSMIRTYQRQEGGSLYMVILSTLYIMLSRYTGAKDMVIGCPIAAREHMDLKNQIGFYTNTLAMRNQLETIDTFKSFFSKVKQSVLEAHDHQQYPFDQLVNDLELKKDLSRNPLFDVMLVVLPDAGVAEKINEEETNSIVLEKNTTSKFDLLFTVEERSENLSFKIEYNSDLYEESLIRQFIGHYKKMVRIVLSQPQKRIASINYLSEKGLQNSNINPTNYQPNTVISLFEKQVIKTPDAIAVCYKDITLTYKQLNEHANQIAFYLKDLEKQTKNKNIGVLLERSHFNVIAMIGVIKSGACYVPIDAKYSEDRKTYIINDAEITTILSTTDICDKTFIDKAKVICLDNFTFSNWDSKNPSVINSLKDSSYIIYTSGSTGNPKGVIQTHRTLSNLIQWNIYDADIEYDLKYLQYSSFSFDMSLQDCWSVLSAGGTLFITPELMKINFSRLVSYIVEKDIKVLSFPFSALSNFFEFIDDEFIKEHELKHIISTGEQLTVGNGIEKFLLEFPEVKLHNHYGPSETHVVTSYTVCAEENNITPHVPIGKPVANTTIYILDKDLQPVPEQVVGEIYIGGEHLAMGYVKLPKLTEERFIANPLNKKERLYSTGDLGYRNDEGIITYLGRNDDQVKIRGYRIELAEIKKAILSYSNIHQVHIDVINRKNEKVIVAYVAGNEVVSRQLLHRELGKQLPKYMIPSYIVTVSHIPLNSNGKIAKNELPEITDESLVKAIYVAPKTKIERELVIIWEKILDISSIGILDNFFELGGHSLKMSKMLNWVKTELEVEITFELFLSDPTIESMALHIENLQFVQNDLKSTEKRKIII